MRKALNPVENESIEYPDDTLERWMVGEKRIVDIRGNSGNGKTHRPT